MMNSPEGYKKENENKSIEELILERTKLFNEMVEYEQKHIIKNEPEEVTKPSPKDIYNMHNLYLKEITDLIIEKAKQKRFEDYMYKVASDATMDTSWIKEMAEKDLNEGQEYLKYSKLYEEKFGKKAYIAEPSGTMEQTIAAIKTCLERNEDLLDSLLYPEDSHFEFYKKNENDKVWWIDRTDKVGEHLFSFDKKKIYNLFRDYPHELTKEEKEIFDKENPYWVDFFKDRQQPESNKSDNIPTCPICKNKLSFMMPDGKTLHCFNCNKYFENNNGVAGEETGSPYTRTDVLY